MKRHFDADFSGAKFAKSETGAIGFHTVPYLDGDYTCTDASSLDISDIEAGKQRCIALTLTFRPSRTGLVHAMSPDEARQLAGYLVAAAQDLEAQAATAATAAIDKAAGK